MANKLPDSIRFFYQKSQLFRVIHADGIMGGITPRGMLHFAFYSERAAFPQSQVHNISPDGLVSEPVSTEGKEGIVRELDVDVIMSKKTAVDFRDWLNAKIAEFEAIEQSPPRGSDESKNDA